MGRRVTVGDLALHVQEAGEGPTLLLLHGFSGSAETWQPLLPHLRGFRTLAVDLPGHGQSDIPPDPQAYSVERCAADPLALLDALGEGRTAGLRHPPGGRGGPHLAPARGVRLWAGVGESASPGSEAPRERGARARRDDELADLLLQEGLERFVDLWEAQPLFASLRWLPEATRQRLRCQRLSHSPAGLAAVLRGMSVGRQRPLWGSLAEVAAPALVVVGALDSRYAAIGRRMALALPHGELAVVPGAGHTVHLEQPLIFARIVAEFLERHRPDRREVRA